MSDKPDNRMPPILGAVRPGSRAAEGQARPHPPPRHAASRHGTVHHDAPRRGRAPHGQRPDRRRSGLVSFVLYTVMAAVVLAVAAVGVLLLNPPADLVRDQLVAQVRQKTGRELTIEGKTRLSLVPSLGVTLEGVRLSAPPTMPGSPLITSESLELQVSLLPLLLREVRVDRLVLNRPVIDLRVDGSGRRSWDFAAATDLRRDGHVRVAQAGTRGHDGQQLPKELLDFAKNAKGPPKNGGPLSGLNDVSLGDVQIVAGTVRYADQRNGLSYTLSGFDCQISLKDLAGPLNVVGQFQQSGERIALDLTVDQFQNAIENRPTRISVRVGSRPLVATYEGNFAGGAAPQADGKISIRTPSLDALSRLASLPVSGLEPLGAVALNGRIKLAGTKMTLGDVSAALGEAAADGQLTVDIGGGRPSITGNLKFATLDVDRIAAVEPVIGAMARGVPAAVPAPVPSHAGRFAPPPGSGLGSAKSIEDLINRDSGGGEAKPGPQVKGFTKRKFEGWNSEPLNLAGLRLADFGGRLDFGKLVVGGHAVEQIQSTVKLKDGVLRIDLAQARLYNGNTKGVVSVDAREPVTTMGINLSGDGFAMLPLLGSFANIDLLDGSGRMLLAVSSKGGSERELIGALAGKAELHIGKGALVGWDVNQLLDGLTRGRVPTLDRDVNARTSFNALSGTFQITNGVARTQDLRLDSSTGNAAGSGVVNLVDRNMNLLVKPQIAKGGIEVPIRIAGAFDDLKVVPEISDVLRQPKVQDAIRRLQSGDVDGALKGVLGDDAKAQEKIGKAKELLRNLWKR